MGINYKSAFVFTIMVCEGWRSVCLRLGMNSTNWWQTIMVLFVYYTEVIMTANNVVPENLVVVRELWELYLNERRVRPIIAKRFGGLWLVARGVYGGKSPKVNEQQTNFQELLCFQSLSPPINFSSNYWVQFFWSIWFPAMNPLGV